MASKRTAARDHDAPLIYQIRLKGHLSRHWSEWFAGMTIELQDNGETLLTGPVLDQAALHGLLRKVRDVGLPLVALIQQGDQHMKTIDITTEEKAMNSYRKTARIAGLLFLAGTVTALPMSFIESILTAPNYLTGIAAHSTQVLIGALFLFLAAVFSGSIAISLYPVLRKQNEALALGAVGFRLLEPVFYIVNIIGILALVTLSQDFVKAGAPAASAYQIVGTIIQAVRTYASYAFGVSTFSLGALMYYVVFYQSRLIPRWLSGWGLLAATLSLTAAFLVMFGLKPLSPFFIVLILPIFFQEIVLEGWLIFKGFNPSAIASE